MSQMMFSIYDKKARDYSSPFISKTQQDAIRKVASTLQKGGTLLSQFPEDYELYYVGGFDPDTGLLLPMDRPEIIMRVDNILAAFTSSKEVENG